MLTTDELPAPRPFPVRRRTSSRLALERAVASRDRYRWNRPSGALSAGMGVLATTGAVGAYMAFAPVSDTSRVRCYTTTNLGSDDDYQGTDAAIANSDPDSSSPVEVTDPVGLCASLWRSGVLVADQGQPGAPAAGTRTVPELVACTLPDGVAAVFPGGAGTCERVGLPSTTSLP